MDSGCCLITDKWIMNHISVCLHICLLLLVEVGLIRFLLCMLFFLLKFWKFSFLGCFHEMVLHLICRLCGSLSVIK